MLRNKTSKPSHRSLPSSTSKRNNTNKPRRQTRRPHHRMAHVLSQLSSTRSFSTANTNPMETIRIHTKDAPILPNFDYVVVGGGSGGIASARRAASYGAKVAVIEGAKLGGTCVNVGCVPKKLMWYAAHIGHGSHDAEAFGFDQLLADDKSNLQYNWAAMKTKRDAYIHRLNSMYYRNALRDGIYIIRGKGEFDLDENGEPDLSTLVIKPTDRDSIDISDKYLDGFKIEEFKGKEVFVDDGNPIKIKLNHDHAPASYKGSQIDTIANSTPLTASTNFITTAPGGYPSHFDFPGGEHVSDSNSFFSWTKQPRRVCVTGGGYIGVELSQVMANLGSHVTYVIRGKTVLQTFDHSITEALMPELEKQCTMVKESALIKVVKLSQEEIDAKTLKGERRMTELEEKELFSGMHRVVDPLAVPENVYAVYAGLCKDGNGCPNFLGYYDVVLSAIGRAPATHVMNVPTSVTGSRGHIKVDEMGAIVDDNAKNVFAVGDVLGKADLTPVAISYGRRLADWLFGAKGQNPLVWSDKTATDPGLPIPSVVFSHPPIGSCGLSTAEAEKAYGKDNVRVWNAKFTPMYCSLLADDAKFQAVTKIITTREFCKYTQQEEDIVIGIHLLFPGADECMQGFAIAVANRLPKSFIDNTIAIHPSAAEELVLFR